uniref:light-harvesting complex-like protein OHP2, chloroplastic n=1 Tax=Erigeron canadensis TaxID=72917 RepID=UPI001CB9C413|nr:light-harvesting complex-like protein OHP2, chloroplastic [Erigeron canadensis]
MSLASMQSIKVTNSLLLNSSSHSCTSLSTVSKLPFCTSNKRSTITITCSQADGPLRRPSIASPPVRPSAPENSPPPAPVSAPPEPTAVGGQNVVTMEFQRQKAKELQQYFKQKKLEEANVGPFFGFIAKNEISNGRWAMFGFAVGMLTEYATGSDFVDQVKILLSNFGIVDLD